MRTSFGLDGLDDDTEANVADALWMPAFTAESLSDEVRERLGSEKNSGRAFGERMRYRLRGMAERPDSHTPSYRRRYERLVEHCDTLSAHQAYVMNDFLGQDKSRGISGCRRRRSPASPGRTPRRSAPSSAGTT